MRRRAGGQLGLVVFLAVAATVWPVAGAAPIPLAAAYLTPADCTKTATGGTHGWNTAGTWTPSGVPAPTDVVCIPDGATVQYDVPTLSGDATVVGIVSDATNAPTGTATLAMGFTGTSNLILSGGVTADKASTIGHLTGGGLGGALTAAETALPTIIRFLDSCTIAGPGDYRVTQGGLGGQCFMSGTGTPTPLITLAASILQTGGWSLTNRQLVIESGVTLTVQGQAMTLQSGAEVQNRGTITLAPLPTDNDPSWTAFSSDTVVENASGGLMQKLTVGTSGVQVLGVRMVNNGTVVNATGGTLVVGGPNFLVPAVATAVIVGGPVTGTGTFAPLLVHDDGALGPGDPLGAMGIGGGYTVRTGLSGGPLLDIQLGGTGVGQADQLNATGTCTLAGTLTVTLVNGYVPALGDSFPVVRCLSIVGTFGIVNLPTLASPLHFDVVYDTTNVPNAVMVVVNGPTAATFRSFTANRARKGVLLRWRTAAEADTLGFNVYRGSGSSRHRLNRHLIASRGQTAGSSYSFLDRGAARHAAPGYWLQVVDTHGARTWQGPARPQRR